MFNNEAGRVEGKFEKLDSILQEIWNLNITQGQMFQNDFDASRNALEKRLMDIKVQVSNKAQSTMGVRPPQHLMNLKSHNLAPATYHGWIQ